MLKTPFARLAGVLRLPHLGLIEEWEAGLMASHSSILCYFHGLLSPRATCPNGMKSNLLVLGMLKPQRRRIFGGIGHILSYLEQIYRNDIHICSLLSPSAQS
jgi:hypothetical protein